VTYTIGGTITGLAPHVELVLTNNGGNRFVVVGQYNRPGLTFTFPAKVTSGSGYSVAANAYGLTCKVSGGDGIATADVTSVAVKCSSIPNGSLSGYTVGGTVTGLVGQGLTLDIYNAANTAHHAVWLGTIAIVANGAYEATRVVDGYGVLVSSQPQSPSQNCVIRFPWGSYLFNLDPLPDHIVDVDIVCGEFTFVADRAANTIATLNVDASSGALTQAVAPASSGQGPVSMAMSRDKRYLYTGNSGSNDISGFALDAGTGALTTIAGSPFAAGSGPAAMARSSVVTVGYGPPVLTDYLYVADKGSNDLRGFRIDQNTGALVALDPASYATGVGPAALVIAPTIAYGHSGIVYVANQIDATISAFLTDDYTGALTPVEGSPFPATVGVNGLAWGAAGKYLYALGGNGPDTTIRGFRIKPAIGRADDGALSHLTAPDIALPSCNAIVADQQGVYLYAAAGSKVYEYAIGPQTGALSPLPGSPVAVGANAGTLTIDPTNRFLYVGSGSAKTMTGYALDATTGALTPLAGSPYAIGGTADVVRTF
jgi:6-phosphogluconolactonase (cycloisomerase 2 family)